LDYNELEKPIVLRSKTIGFSAQNNRFWNVKQ